MHLKKRGLHVYAPGTKEGECLKPYVVVKDAGASKSMYAPATAVYYDLLMYVPKNMYSSLETYVKRVEMDMDDLWPMIRPTHTRTTAYFDEDVKGWMVSMQYVNYAKNKRP